MSNEEAADFSIPSFAEATRTWAYIGLNSFGGPAGQIAVMHRVLVEEKKWVKEEQFLHALNYCMLLPGPEAQQLATYIGWLFHGWRGGMVAGTLFIIPGIVVIMALSYLYAGFHDISAIEALFFGLKAAVLAIVVEAVIRIGKRALKTRFHVFVAAVAFIAIFFLHVPFPLIVLGAALLGLMHGQLRPASVVIVPQRSSRPTARRAFGVLALFGALWSTPLLLLWFMRGSGDVYFNIGTFFSKAAVVTFGGAYSVLAYIAQQAVEVYGWLVPGEMLDGLAMAETTPGPLIMVVQFVGFMAAFRNPGELHPMLAGTLGGLLTTWVTFVPCFLWILLGAPYIERLRGNRALNAALSAITAAVVGVVLNLAIWFSIHVIFVTVTEQQVGPLYFSVPEAATIQWAAAALSGLALVLTFKFHWSIPKTLAVCALLGLVYRLAFG